jgi:hypothetical protein
VPCDFQHRVTLLQFQARLVALQHRRNVAIIEGLFAAFVWMVRRNIDFDDRMGMTIVGSGQGIGKGFNGAEGDFGYALNLAKFLALFALCRPQPAMAALRQARGVEDWSPAR